MSEQSTTTPADVEIPKGYWLKSDGSLVHERNVHQVDKDRTRMVEGVVKAAVELQKAIVAFKAASLQAVDSFVAESAAKHGVKHGRVKGNMTLPTFDGGARLQVRMQDSIEFDERLQIAKAKVDSFINRKAKNAAIEIKALVQDAFEVDSKGAVNVRKVLELRKHNFDDAEWQEAMTLIADSVTRTFAKRYLLVQTRRDQGGYQTLTLNASDL